MLKWLFGSRASAAERGEDHVWISHAARLTGVARAVAGLAEAGGSVVVVAITPAALDEIVTRVENRRPVRCVDVFSQHALGASLARAGSVAVALDRALPAAATSPRPPGPVHLIVVGRHDARSDDEAIVRFADAIGPKAHVAFHLSLEDPLIRDFGATLGATLERLGMSDDQPITHAMVTRAIAKAQRQRAG